MIEIELPHSSSRSPSPIWPLFEFSPMTLETVAPERMGQLGETADGVRLLLRDDPVWQFYYSPGEKRIVASRRAMELLWSAALVHYLLKRIDEQGGSQKERLGRARHETVQAALRLYKETVVDVAGRQGNVMVPWPDWAPIPVPPSIILPGQAFTPEQWAGEMCLSAIGVVYHHELAHHYLRHAAGDVSRGERIEEERDADVAALDWVLDGRDVPVKALAKRMIGALIAYSTLTSVELIQHSSGEKDSLGQTHPLSHDRLFRIIERQVDPVLKETAWLFASVALRLNLTFVDLVLPPRVYEHHEEVVMTCVGLLDQWFADH